MRETENYVTISPGDIIVTTPKSEMERSAEEAKRCIECGGGFYFRRFTYRPKRLNKGSILLTSLWKRNTKIFYVENGYIQGFGIVTAINYSNGMKCESSARNWDKGWYALMPACTWKWIEPIRCKGFRQPFRYFNKLFPEIKRMKVIGGWRDEKPKLKI